MTDETTFALRWARARRVIGGAALALCGAAAIVLSAGAVTGEHVESESTAFPTLMLMLGAIILLAGLTLAWRGGRVRVVITRSEVVVHEVAGTKRIPFTDIAGFETARHTAVAPIHTVLRLTAGPHGIPRSVTVPAASPSTTLEDWLSLAMLPFAMGINARMGEQLVRTPRASWLSRRVDRLVEAMNAELDRRRGAGTSAELLAAAHPKFRTILHDD